MSSVEEVSKIIVILLLAFWLLQVLTKGNGTNWITSFFSNNGTSTGTTAITSTGGSANITGGSGGGRVLTR